MKRTVLPAVGIAVLAIGAAWWLVLHTGSFAVPPGLEIPVGDGAPAPTPGARTPGGSQVMAIPSTPRPPVGPSAASLALREEIRDATNLRALYDRVKDLPDTTGERSYRLAEAIFECSAFIDQPLEAVSRRLAVKPAALENTRRNQLLASMFERCKGFSGLGARFQEIYRELHQRAEAARYPAEVARSLRFEPGIQNIENADQVARGLLASSPDPETLYEISQYLALRNRGVEQQRGIDGQTRAIAWGLLECHYGADCGPQSRSLSMTCIVMGACDLTRIEEAVMVQGASQATVSNALRLRDQLAQRLADRDWVGLGFIERSNK